MIKDTIDKRFVKGDLVWKDGVQDTEVVFLINPKGRFTIENERSKKLL